jgi:hypothetical protein
MVERCLGRGAGQAGLDVPDATELEVLRALAEHRVRMPVVELAASLPDRPGIAKNAKYLTGRLHRMAGEGWIIYDPQTRQGVAITAAGRALVET